MIDPDRPVRVFRNFRHGCYSIMQGGVVRASARQVRLADVEFRVRESGRERMLREGRKTVHAFAVGRLVDWVHPDDARDLATLAGRTLDYDPHRFATFFDRDSHAPVRVASALHLDERGATYAPGEDLPRAA